jgi:type II secretory pathway pseudopilin PulG
MKGVSVFRAAAAATILLALLSAGKISAQEARGSDPASALAEALAAACRANETQFANYLTADNAAAFRALPADRQRAFLKRMSLGDEAGKPLLSSDAQNHTVLRCVTPSGTAEFRFGDTRTSENLTFISVAVVNSEATRFGLVREASGWRLISLGLVLLDIPQLSKQWAESDLAAREDAALETLRGLAGAVESYRSAYGKLPESLAQLGPAPKDEVSPEQASLVNEHLAAGSAGGYRFRYRLVGAAQGGDDAAFEVVAAPEEYGKTGRRSFLLDSTGKIHGADRHGGMAAPDDPVIP